MATGYWKTVYGYDENGKRVSRQVWVPATTTSTPSGGDAAARLAAQRRLAAQQARARAIALAKRTSDAAARRAAEARARSLANSASAKAAEMLAMRRLRDGNIAKARSESYRRLQERQKSLLNYQRERDQMNASKAAVRKQVSVNQQRAAAKASADANMDAQKRALLGKTGYDRWAGKGGQGEFAGGPRTGATTFSGQDITQLEKVIAWEAENSKKGKFSKDTDRLMEAYEKYADKIGNEYEDAILAVNEAIDKYNKTKKDSDLDKARALYAEYMKARPEFERLFGNGKNPLEDGAVNETRRMTQQIGLAQRDWWRSQMRASFQSTIDSVRDSFDRDGPQYRQAQEMLDLLNGKIETRWVDDGFDPMTRERLRRRATFEEEIALREAEKIAQMEKMRAAYEAFKVKEKVQMMREGYVEYKGRGYVERQQVPAIAQAEETMQKYFNGKFEPTRPNDIHNFVGKMLGDWEAKNPRPAGGNARDIQYLGAAQIWEDRRKRAEDSYYQFFGLGSQGILEKGIDTPGIRHALTLLGTPFAAVGAGARVANAAIFGENTIGGFKPTYLDVPQFVKDAAAKLPSGGGQRGQADQRRAYIERWIKTPQGQQWYNAEYAKRKQTDAQAGLDFNAGFYGHDPNKDWLQGFEALGNYGNSPFQNAGANLLASLLLDPLNAIPLKFLKYLDRGRFAMNTAKDFTGAGGKLLGKTQAYKFFSTFRSVDEGTLSLIKHADGLSSELRATGHTIEEFTGLLRERVLGVTEKSAKEAAIRGLFRELGLNPRKVNEAQIFSIAEHLIAVKAGNKGRTIWSAADEAKKKIAAADADRAAKAEQRARVLREQQRKVNDETARVKAEAETARAVQGTIKTAEEGRLAKIVADEKAAAAKQAGVAGKAAGPTPPAQTADDFSREAAAAYRSGNHAEGVRLDTIAKKMRGGTDESGGAMKSNAPKPDAEYHGLPVKPLVQREGKDPLGAAYNKAEKTIYVDDVVMEKKYAEKAWTKPRKLSDGTQTEALTEDAFRSFEDFRAFALEHEYQHSILPRKRGETLGEYETRINRAALSGGSPSLAASEAYIASETRHADDARVLHTGVDQTVVDMQSILDDITGQVPKFNEERLARLGASFPAPTSGPLVSVKNNVKSLIYKLVDNGWEGVTPEALKQMDEIAEAFAKDPELASLLKSARKEAGDIVRAERLKVSNLKSAPLPLETASLSMSEIILARIFKMSEPEWYAYRKEILYKGLKLKSATAPAKAAARKEIAQIELAEKGLLIAKNRGSHIRWQDRAKFQASVLRSHWKDAKGRIAPKMIAPLVGKAGDVGVEQARIYYKALRRASPSVLPSDTVIRIGGKEVDHLPLKVFRELDRRMSEAISAAKGHKADTLTKTRRAAGELEDSTRPLGKMSDTDPLIIATKEKVLKEYARETGDVIPLAAYDEARMVLWKGHTQSMTADRLLAETARIVARYGGDHEEVYMALRQKWADQEARRQLGGLAFGEMYGFDPEVVWGEFLARYSQDGVIREFAPELTSFQRRTLEESFLELSGHTIDDAATPGFLQSVNGPPFNAGQGATRDFLRRIGVWSPRTTEDFIVGQKSWSVFDEEAHWLAEYGEAPPWTTVRQLEGEFNDIFDDQHLYIAFHKQQGVFSRSKELSLRVEGRAGSKRIEEAHFKGDDELDLQARRSLEDQRRYVIERFGRLVSKDGVTLDRMPWLMHPEELRPYMVKTTAKRMPDGFIRNAKELAHLEELINSVMDRFWKKYMEKGLDDGAPILQEDIFRLASEIQARLMADPRWARRVRDVFGGTLLDAWSSLNRWLIFSNPSFMVMNVVDAPIKTMWYRFSRRGLFQRTLDNVKYADDGKALTLEMMGFDSVPAYYREAQKPVIARLRDPRGYTSAERAVDRVLTTARGTGAIFPAVAGKAEAKMKLHLAQGMWPQVYDTMIKRFKDPDLARAASLDFVKKEIGRMWPTAGNGPIEQLWNRFVPFSSYQVRNKILWISEAIDHPVVLSQFDRIGRYIEEENVKNWEENPENKGQPMPENLRRLIELPWAKGSFIDLGQFTDASRGLSPLYETYWKDNLHRFNDWIRVINPSMLSGFLAVANAFNIAQRTAWVRVLDANDFPTGQWREVTVPWTEPWSREQANMGSMFWFLDAIQTGQKYGIDGWDQGESSAMIGQVFLFNAIKTYDKLGVTYGWYKGLSKADRATFQATPEGYKLMEWLRDKMTQPKGFNLTLTEMMQQHDADPAAWWHSQSLPFRAKVNAARDKIKLIRDTFAANMYLLQPGTAEYKQMKARMYLAISDVYSQSPELLAADVYSKSASEWAAQTTEWETDSLIDTYFALGKQRPERASFPTTAAYRKAVEDWEHAKKVFLNTYPQVAKALAGEISSVAAVRGQIERQWDAVLGRISKRTDAINEAKTIIKDHGRDSVEGKAAQGRIDLLYLQNDLDYSLLERDYAASYFTADDMKRTTGAFTVKTGLVKRTQIFLDFDATIYQKHLREGTLEDYLAKAQYGQMMKAASLYAKGGDPFGEFSISKWMKYMKDNPKVMEKYFGNDTSKRDAWAKASVYVEGMRAIWAKAGDDPAKFVRLLKQNPRLLAEYFKRNPGKQAQWEHMDAYIRNISVWGKLIGAKRYEEANAAWDRLPQWVKDEYYKKHPERRKQAQATAQYLGFMDKWVKLVQTDEKKGMEYFRSLPKWAQDRYFSKHPENRLKFEANEEMNSLIAGYFATDESARAEYLAKNPKMKEWLAKNVGSAQAERLAIMQAYNAIPKEDAWLRRAFREKYPEIFSAEAKGTQKLKSIYSILTDNPQAIPGFEKWVAEIWRTYSEMLRLGAPRPAKLYFERDRAGERAARERMKSRSAADVSNA